MNPNSGSFGAASGGGGGAVAAAIKSRGLPENVLSQVTGGSANFSEQAAPAPIPAGAPSAIPGGAPGLPGPSQPGGVATPSESTTIIKALDSKLKSLSKIEEHNAGII